MTSSYFVIIRFAFSLNTKHWKEIRSIWIKTCICFSENIAFQWHFRAIDL